MSILEGSLPEAQKSDLLDYLSNQILRQDSREYQAELFHIKAFQAFYESGDNEDQLTVINLTEKYLGLTDKSPLNARILLNLYFKCLEGPITLMPALRTVWENDDVSIKLALLDAFADSIACLDTFEYCQTEICDMLVDVRVSDSVDLERSRLQALACYTAFRLPSGHPSFARHQNQRHDILERILEVLEPYLVSETAISLLKRAALDALTGCIGEYHDTVKVFVDRPWLELCAEHVDSEVRIRWIRLVESLLLVLPSFAARLSPVLLTLVRLFPFFLLLT